MKKTVLCAVLLAASIIGFAQKDCIVKGKAKPEQAGMYVYVLNGRQIQDSAKINQDATFSFSLSAEEKVLQCATRGSNETAVFVSEKGDVLLNLVKQEVKGGKLNSILQQYQEVNSKIMNQYNESSQTIQNLSISNTEKEAQMEELVEKTIKTIVAETEKVIEANLDNEIGGYMLAEISQYYDVEEFFAQYDKLSDRAKDCNRLQSVHKNFTALRNTAEGKIFVDFTIEKGSLEGKDVKFSDYVGKGKYTLVDFWATWCGPCKREIPNLRQINKDFGDKITVLSVAVWDKREATEKFISQNDMPWNHIIDAQTIPTDLYGINGIPQIILFAPDGTIVKRDLRGEQIRETLEEVLGKYFVSTNPFATRVCKLCNSMQDNGKR